MSVVQLLLLVPVAYWVAVALPLVWVDLRERRLPNVIVLPGVLLTLVASVAAAVVSGDWVRFWFSFMVAVLLCVAGFLVSLHGVLGMGDVKLFLGLALSAGSFGLALPMALLAVALVGAALVALGLIVMARTGRILWNGDLALGPFLLVGYGAAMAVPLLG
jgi:leader peptidase (prepilin peptidase)/N-methyltransferase